MPTSRKVVVVDPNAEPMFFVLDDLIARWRVGRSTLYQEMKSGRLKRTILAGTVRFSRAEVHRYEREAGASGGKS